MFLAEKTSSLTDFEIRLKGRAVEPSCTSVERGERAGGVNLEL
jgi:hypothetical protein